MPGPMTELTKSLDKAIQTLIPFKYFEGPKRTLINLSYIVSRGKNNTEAQASHQKHSVVTRKTL